MFYTYRQNNSGGFWDSRKYIIVEANTFKDANTIAEKNTPVYFNGMSKGIDCPCCGDRWRYSYDDGEHFPSKDGKCITDDDTDYAIYYLNGEITEKY